jgi:hypothetical protein
MNVSFLAPGEELVRRHRFRFTTAQGCALGSVDVVVDELLGPLGVGARYVARPDHPRLVARPEYTARGDTLDGSLRVLIEHMRQRPLTDVFFPER